MYVLRDRHNAERSLASELCHVPLALHITQCFYRTRAGAPRAAVLAQLSEPSTLVINE